MVHQDTVYYAGEINQAHTTITDLYLGSVFICKT